ncbi:hypothetical protein DLM75_04085 [Leptospira stimsonii]|uniref:Uncharacterized protein n=1 Tax=Leptospira stimsonii TaxID=2202203 RepID=A0A396ZGV0_9LEPT|nr:hypothetical protein DLM75_04085 [Leptospira stimsonii]
MSGKQFDFRYSKKILKFKPLGLWNVKSGKKLVLAQRSSDRKSFSKIPKKEWENFFEISAIL